MVAQGRCNCTHFDQVDSTVYVSIAQSSRVSLSSGKMYMQATNFGAICAAVLRFKRVGVPTCT